MAQTPLSPLPFEGFTLTMAAGVVQEAPIAPYSNTKEVIINNLSTTDSVSVQVAVVTPALPGPWLPAVGVVVPASSALALCIGVEGERTPLATRLFWTTSGAVSPADLNLVFLSAGTDDVNITYVQSAGGGGSVGGGC